LRNKVATVSCKVTLLHIKSQLQEIKSQL